MKFAKLDDLSELKKGVHKEWVYKDSNAFHLAHDYLQKINFSIQDINGKSTGLKADNESITFIVCCVAWIEEACTFFNDSFKNNVVSGFKFSNEKKLIQAKKYFKAVRSFILAHPLGTNKHEDFDLDGKYICIDVMPIDCPSIVLLSSREECFMSLGYEGMKEGKTKCDFFLKTYSEEFHDSKYSVYIGIHLEDILGYARLCIEKLYELDKYLGGLKKKDFEVGNHE